MASYFILTCLCFLLLYVPAVFGRKRLRAELDEFKDVVRKELDVITKDSRSIQDMLGNFMKTVSIHKEFADGSLQDGEEEDVNGERKQEIKSPFQTIVELLLENNLILKALEQEKRLNHLIEQRVNALENRVEQVSNAIQGSSENQTSNMASLENAMTSFEQYLEKNIQTVREDVKKGNENVGKLINDFKNLTETCLKVSKQKCTVEERVHTKGCRVDENSQNVDEAIQPVTLKSCKAALDSGVYNVYFESINTTVPVYCDQDTDGGGWIVIMRRQDGSVNFTRPWLDYKNGFGDKNGEFWSGNEFLHEITKSKPVRLRIDMGDFEGDYAHAQYRKFQIGPEDDKYRLDVYGYSGNAGDSLLGTEVAGWVHNGQQFTTYDSDNDQSKKNCAGVYKGGGWWFNKCGLAHLTGRYRYTANIPDYLGIRWWSWKRSKESLKFVEMKIRVV